MVRVKLVSCCNKQPPKSLQLNIIKFYFLFISWSALSKWWLKDLALPSHDLIILDFFVPSCVDRKES